MRIFFAEKDGVEMFCAEGLGTGGDSVIRPATEGDKATHVAAYLAFKGPTAKAEKPAELAPIPVADIPVAELPEPPKALMEAWDAPAESDEHKSKKKHK